jgi:hypothetical protein
MMHRLQPVTQFVMADANGNSHQDPSGFGYYDATSLPPTQRALTIYLFLLQLEGLIASQLGNINSETIALEDGTVVTVAEYIRIEHGYKYVPGIQHVWKRASLFSSGTQ